MQTESVTAQDPTAADPEASDPMAAIGRWARTRISIPPWASGLGFARTLLAVGTLATLLATPPRVLMSPLAGGVVPPICTGISQASIWCVLPHGHLELARWLQVGILAVVASGWRPRCTAIPHWWVAWSLFASASVQDGGDQITAVLALILIPVALGDSRVWHWQAPSPDQGGPMRRLVAVMALILIQLQVAGLYLDAGLSKLGVPEWANGTAMFYLFHSVIFGAPAWLQPITTAVTSQPLGVALLTWGSIALEILLGIALLLPARIRPYLLSAGLLFHDGIAVSMGLVSFDCAMTAALLLYLLPVGRQLTLPAVFRRAELRRRWTDLHDHLRKPDRIFPLPLPENVTEPASDISSVTHVQADIRRHS